MIRILYLTTVAALLFSCGSGTKKTAIESDRPAAKNEEAGQWFDTGKLEEKDIHIEKKDPVKISESPKAIEKPVDPIVEEESKANEIVSGFRIQLSASKDSKKMRDALTEAKSFFNPRGYEVYLVYESPMYKLRVGDALDRKRAEKLLSLCQDNGYRDAWIVPDMINSALDQGDE
jgi:cell division septation protein DedD